MRQPRRGLWVGGVFARAPGWLAALLLAGLMQVALAAPAAAATAAELDRLWRLMRLDEVIAVMRDEGLAYGGQIDADMLEGTGGADWAAAVSEIYDTGRMAATTRAAFHAALKGSDVSGMTAFFASPLGARVLGLELAARRATLDKAVEEAARARAEALRAEGGPRVALLLRFAEVNDMVESNVAGAMNANFQFYRGLAAAGALEPGMDDAAILAEVWSGEPAVRQDTEAWVLTFVALSYEPLTDAELLAYSDASASAGGQVLNRAVFDAFDGMFNGISFALGRELGLRLAGRDL